MLNLPQLVTVSSGTSTFIYDATGNKLRKITALGTAKDTVDYVSGIQYKNRNIDFIQTEEGKIAYNKTTGVYDYEYYLGDNLGNTRVTFNIQNGVATALQRDDYMPFGYEISNGSPANPKNEYLYNKKELQEELTEYDYGARFYDPLMGRWNTIDPHSDNYKPLSPYNYVANNPIKSIDPDGRDIIVLLNSKSVSGNGHLALLVGNDRDGWQFISKAGRDKSKPFSNEVTGGPSTTGYAKFNTLKEFNDALKDVNNKNYAAVAGYDKLSYYSTTGKDQDVAAFNAVLKDSQGWYHFLFANCADAVSDGLSSAGLDPGYNDPDATPDWEDGDNIRVIPFVRFDRIIKNNKVKQEEEKKEQEAKDKAKVTAGVIKNISNLLPGTYHWDGKTWVQD